MADRVDDLDAAVDEMRQDPAFAAAHDDAGARLRLLRALIARRKEAGLSQTDVAERMGTTQSAVSDFEGGATDPHLSTFQRYARAVGFVLSVAAAPASREGDGQPEGWRERLTEFAEWLERDATPSEAFHRAFRRHDAPERRLDAAADLRAALAAASQGEGGLATVQGRCPACGDRTLFLGAGGYVTCSRSDCPKPIAATDVLMAPCTHGSLEGAVACEHNAAHREAWSAPPAETGGGGLDIGGFADAGIGDEWPGPGGGLDREALRINVREVIAEGMRSGDSAAGISITLFTGPLAPLLTGGGRVGG